MAVGRKGQSFIIFVTLSEKGRCGGALSYKLSVGGINVAPLVKAGRGERAKSMPVGVSIPTVYPQSSQDTMKDKGAHGGQRRVSAGTHDSQWVPSSDR